MDLWVANTTKQTIKFKYRFPEQPGVKTAVIPIGTNVRLHKTGLSQIEADSLIEQLEKGWGAVNATALGRARDYVGLAYSIDKPVKSAAIAEAVEHNTDVLTEQGKEARTQAAVAVHEAMADREGQSGAGRNNLSKSTVEIVEQVGRGEEPAVNERVEVRREGEGSAPTGGRKKRGS